MDNNKFPTTLEYSKEAVKTENALNAAIEGIIEARVALEDASSYVFSKEIKTLDEMHKALHQTDLLLCSMGTRRVKIKENERP